MRKGMVLFWALIVSGCSEEEVSRKEVQFYSDPFSGIFQNPPAVTTFLYYKGVEIQKGSGSIFTFALRVKNNTKDTIKEIKWACETWSNFIMDPIGILEFYPNPCYSNTLDYRILPPQSNTVIPLYFKSIGNGALLKKIKFRIGYRFLWGFEGKSPVESQDMYLKMQVEIPVYWSNYVILKDDQQQPDSLVQQ